MTVDRRAQCCAWNADRQHQVMAGRARAHAFTRDYQSAAGHASFAAFSARMRAGNGSPQLFPEAAAKYVAPEQIGSYVGPLPSELQQIIHAAWAAGNGWGIDHWLGEPLGSLFAPEDDTHTWQVFAPGWVVCSVCFLAAFCPACFPTWPDDPILPRLPQVLCQAHGGCW